MCQICNYKTGSTPHLLYWQKEWLKRFFTTWYHLVNRKAYWRWHKQKYGWTPIQKGLLDAADTIDLELTEEDWKDLSEH